MAGIRAVTADGPGRDYRSHLRPKLSGRFRRCRPRRRHSRRIAQGQKVRRPERAYDFRPVGAETLGAFGPQAIELVNSISARIVNEPATPARAHVFCAA